MQLTWLKVLIFSMIPFADFILRVFYLNGTLDQFWTLFPLFQLPLFGFVPIIMMKLGLIKKGKINESPFDYFVFSFSILSFIAKYLIYSIVFYFLVFYIFKCFLYQKKHFSIFLYTYYVYLQPYLLVLLETLQSQHQYKF